MRNFYSIILLALLLVSCSKENIYKDRHRLFLEHKIIELDARADFIFYLADEIKKSQTEEHLEGVLHQWDLLLQFIDLYELEVSLINYGLIRQNPHCNDAIWAGSRIGEASSELLVVSEFAELYLKTEQFDPFNAILFTFIEQYKERHLHLIRVYGEYLKAMELE